MAYERMGDSPLDYFPCRYSGSKLHVRGPERPLEGRYTAFLGGTETYGKFIEEPFPDLVEARTGVKCVNFGWPNAGVDVYLNDAGILAAASKARLTILQVPCVPNMSNRYYTVHPRRNDRFLEASGMLRAIYNDVDFTEFHFVRHMLRRLQTVSAERFDIIREEMQMAWLSRMQLLLRKIDSKVVLLWMSARRPEDCADRTGVGFDPSYVTREMIETLRPMVADVVEVVASDAALAEGTKGMRFSEMETPAAEQLLGPAAHFEAAEALSASVTDLAGS